MTHNFIKIMNYLRRIYIKFNAYDQNICTKFLLLFSKYIWASCVFAVASRITTTGEVALIHVEADQANLRFSQR